VRAFLARNNLMAPIFRERNDNMDWDQFSDYAIDVTETDDAQHETTHPLEPSSYCDNIPPSAAPATSAAPAVPTAVMYHYLVQEPAACGSTVAPAILAASVAPSVLLPVPELPAAPFAERLHSMVAPGAYRPVLSQDTQQDPDHAVYGVPSDLRTGVGTTSTRRTRRWRRAPSDLRTGVGTISTRKLRASTSLRLLRTRVAAGEG
jgi:hypothetical protein